MFESFAAPWTVAHQALLSMGFPRQEYWNGLPFPSPGDLPDPGIKLAFPALQTDSLPLSHQESPHIVRIHVCMCMHAQMCTHICLKDVCPGVKACRCMCVCVCPKHICVSYRVRHSSASGPLFHHKKLSLWSRFQGFSMWNCHSQTSFSCGSFQWQ